MGKRYTCYKVKKLWKPLRLFVQFICGLRGHSFDGDWGYGGGDYADVWCRHCDHFSQVPKTSIWFKRRYAKALMEQVEE